MTTRPILELEATDDGLLRFTHFCARCGTLYTSAVEPESVGYVRTNGLCPPCCVTERV